MKKLIIGIVLLVWPVASCLAEYRTIVGAGGSSCGKWLEFRETDPTLAGITTSWILGGLTALNFARVKEPDFLKNNVDVAAIQAWMDKYCKEHPLDNINDAFQILALELIKRAKK